MARSELQHYLVTPRYVLGSDSDTIWATDDNEARVKAASWAEKWEITDYVLYREIPTTED